MPKRREPVAAPSIVEPASTTTVEYRSGWSILIEYLRGKPPLYAVGFLLVFSAWIIACSCLYVYHAVDRDEGWWPLQMTAEEIRMALVPVTLGSTLLNFMLVYCMPATVGIARLLWWCWLLPALQFLRDAGPVLVGVVAWAYAMVLAGQYIVKQIT